MKLTILGIPFSKNSQKLSFHGHMYQTPKVKRGESNIQAQILCQIPPDFKPWTGGVAVNRILFVFPWLTSHSKKARASGELRKTTKPDLTDNLMKGLFDAMQGVIYVNDSQVCHLGNADKIYGDRPRIEIEIEEV